MGLAAVVIEEHTRGTVQLRYDNALGTVNHKGTVFRHQGNLPHVDFLLFNILDAFVRRLFIVDDQSNLYAQRHGVSNTAQLAFIDIKRRLAQAVLHILESGIAGVADDGKNGLKGRVQTVVATLFCRRPFLGELPVGVQLNRQEIRYVHDVRHFAKILADTFFLSVRVSHQHSPASYPDLRTHPVPQRLYPALHSQLRMCRRMEPPKAVRNSLNSKRPAG